MACTTEFRNHRHYQDVTKAGRPVFGRDQHRNKPRRRLCTEACILDVRNHLPYHGFIKADLRISVKDYRRNKNLKVQLVRLPFGPPRFWARMNGQPVSLSRLLSALRKALVKAQRDRPEASAMSQAVGMRS